MKNRILIGLFIAMLIGPSFIWECVGENLKTTNAENRALAEKPDLTLSNLKKFPQKYEEYYNDHLAFKSQLVHLQSKINYKYFNNIESEKVLLGKKDWLFYKGIAGENPMEQSPIEDFQGTNRYSQKVLQNIADNIADVDNYLKDRDIQFSILICPNKENIYSDYLPADIEKVHDKSKADLLIEHLAENTTTPVLYPVDELKAEKKQNQVYYKYDTHWNKLGGFIASQEIRNLYSGEKERLEQYKIVRNAREVSGDLSKMINMESEFSKDIDFTVENYKTETTVEAPQIEKDGFFHSFHSNAKDSRTVMVLRDSFGEGMMDSLPKDFQNVIFIHRSVFTADYIKKYNPDIVIYEVVERLTSSMGDMKELFGIK